MPAPDIVDALFKGISFPFRRGSVSFPETAVDDALIREALIQLILTGTSERIMRPTVGSNAYRYVFESNDDLLQERIEHDISTAVSRFEPRVTLLGVQVTRGLEGTEPGPSAVTVLINYMVNATQQTAKVSVTVGV